MKTKLILLTILLSATINTKAQVLLNEVYSDPGVGKHEFFELYNSGRTTESMDDYTLVTFFDISGTTGFYVMDLPNISIAPKSFFVGSAAIPFNYQGVTNSLNSDFTWNDMTWLGSHSSYIRKWTKQTLNLLDGNLFYDQTALPANFNDLFYRRTGMGASYSVFLYKKGVLVNAVIFGTGGYASVIPVIVAMPDLFVDMSGTAIDFTIKFSTYGSALIENVEQDAGSDNGFIRKKDGACASWDKSSSQVQHTPKKSNGVVGSTDGSIAVSSVITPGTPATGSIVNYDVVSAPVVSFPVTVEVYTDLGNVWATVDALDPFVASNTENVVSDGPFSNIYNPHNANILLLVRSNIGCIDKILFVPNALVLPLRLVSFSGNMNKGNITLNWMLTSNELVEKMEIEQSLDGKNFENKFPVSTTDKEGNETYNLGLTEPSKSYYRLRITERSGKVTYSKILVMNEGTETKAPLNIIGNTVTDKVILSFKSQTNQIGDVSILDMGGKLVMKQRIQSLRGTNNVSISLPSTMNNGMYIAALSVDNITSTAKFIKQ